jgi:ATP-dependent helicase/nuclease subunit A
LPARRAAGTKGNGGVKLNAQQEMAAFAAGNVAVTAGAGTGKTAMLAHRFVHHVRSDGFSPLEIAAATFTDKAADELRSRIRHELRNAVADETTFSEIDAAQIGTIHALSARICRDFYYLAGIPADFAVSDETETRIRIAATIDDAMGTIDEDIITALGYSWLKKSLLQLLRDPYTSKELLEFDAEHWKETIEKEKAAALAALQACEAWQCASQLLEQHRAASADDKLENFRLAAAAAMEAVRCGNDYARSLAVFTGFRKNLGAAGNWPNGGLGEIRECLAELRDAFRLHGPWICLEFSKLDEDCAGKIKLLSRAFANVLEHFSAAKRKERVLDYADLEINALHILGSDEAREYYAHRWKALLVDEFQDTNPIQARIIEALAKSAKLTIVGDEKQSIYSFRNADVEVFRQFRNSIVTSGGSEVEMSETFRTHESLVTSCNDLFSELLGAGLHKPLEATRIDAPHAGPHLTIAVVDTDAETSAAEKEIAEAAYIAETIAALIGGGAMVFDKEKKLERAVEYGDIAILSRRWASVETYIETLLAFGIPAVNAGGGSLLATREAKDAIALLSFLADSDDDISLLAVLRGPFFAVSDRVLHECSLRHERGASWWSLIQESADGDLCGPRDVLSTLLTRRTKCSPEELLALADEMTGYAAVIANLPQGSRREADWAGFIQFLRQLGRNGYRDLFAVVRQIGCLVDVESEIPRPPVSAANAVTLSSIHRSKGLEWPVVFVPDLAGRPNHGNELLLTDRSLGIGFKIEEESGERSEPAIYSLIKKNAEKRREDEARRLLYVAITRAQDRVFLTSREGKGYFVDLLRPGLDSSGVPEVVIPAASAILTAPHEMPLFAAPAVEITIPISPRLNKLPATALDTYANCPREFAFRYIEGHPGLGIGAAHAQTVGTLTHTALEFDLQTIEQLKNYQNAGDKDVLTEAIELASKFRSSDKFSAFRGTDTQKEVALKIEIKQVGVAGRADLVGEDWVLDFKTGASVERGVHRFQLWVYAKALKKQKAFIADLRNEKLEEFSFDDLSVLESEAKKLVSALLDGRFDPSPSLKACRRCLYGAICESAYSEVGHTGGSDHAPDL